MTARARRLELVQERHVVRQRRRRTPKAELQPPNVANAGFDDARLARQTYLSLAEAVYYLRFPSVNAFRCWAWRKKVPSCNAGGVKFLRRDLDDAAQQGREVATNR